MYTKPLRPAYEEAYRGWRIAREAQTDWRTRPGYRIWRPDGSQPMIRVHATVFEGGFIELPAGFRTLAAARAAVDEYENVTYR